jgi:hypothetical protein
MVQTTCDLTSLIPDSQVHSAILESRPRYTSLALLVFPTDPTLSLSSRHPRACVRYGERCWGMTACEVLQAYLSKHVSIVGQEAVLLFGWRRRQM